MVRCAAIAAAARFLGAAGSAAAGDRKSTRLNSSHLVISYAVFCLKKKKKADARKRCVHRLPVTSPLGADDQPREYAQFHTFHFAQRRLTQAHSRTCSYHRTAGLTV